MCGFALDSVFSVLWVSSAPAAPSGVCTLTGQGESWPLLFIKGSIDREHGCVSTASHPWTADNGPGTGDVAESNQQQLGENASLLVESV